MKHLLFFLLLFVSLARPAFAQSQVPSGTWQSAWVIPAFDSSIAIQTDGTVLVSEKIDVDFKTLEKHGIYRDIPIVYTDATSEKTYTKITVGSVKQDNQNAEYKLMNEGEYLRIRIGDPDRTISGKHSYEITYTATGVLRAFPEHDELYWDVTGDNWEADIEKATATVTVPKNSIEKTVCFEGYSGSTGSCALGEQTSDKTAVFSNSNTLITGQGITIAVGFTKGTVPILTVDPPKKLEDELFTTPSLLGLLLALGSGITGVVWLWMKHGRDFWFRTRRILDPNAPHEVMPIGATETTVVEFEPPEKLRPAEIGVLVDEQADTLDVTATIIDLANRGYLTIKEIPKKWLFGSHDYELTQTKIPDDTLLGYEKMLLNRLFPDKKIIKISELKTTFYDDLSQVKKQLYADVMKKELFVKNPESTRHIYMGFGVGVIALGGVLIWLGAQFVIGPLFTFGIGTIISGVILMIASVTMPRRSAIGRELYQRAKGYQLFISGAEKYRQQFFEKKNMFNEVLAYAIIFGLTEKFARAMKDMGVTPQQPTWYSGSRAFTTSHFVSDVNSFSKSMSTAIASTPSKSGGFSGGSSGGGFGGGGGGSW